MTAALRRCRKAPRRSIDLVPVASTSQSRARRVAASSGEKEQPPTRRAAQEATEWPASAKACAPFRLPDEIIECLREVVKAGHPNQDSLMLNSATRAGPLRLVCVYLAPRANVCTACISGRLLPSSLGQRGCTRTRSSVDERQRRSGFSAHVSKGSVRDLAGIISALVRTNQYSMINIVCAHACEFDFAG